MNALYSIGYSLTAKGFAFILNYIAINLLLLDSYGQFSLIFSTINSFIVVTSLGLLYCGNIIASKWMHKNREYVFNYFKFSFFLIIFLSLLFSGIYSLFSGNFLIIFLSTFIYSLVFLFDGFLYGVGNIKILFILGIINVIFSLVVSFFLMNDYGLKGALYALVFSKMVLIVLQSIVFFKQFKNLNLNLNLKYKKQIFLFYKKNNIPIILSSLIATPVVTFLMYLLSSNSGLIEVAIFSWCYQIYLAGMFLPMALSSYHLSKLNKEINKSNLLIKIIKFNFITSIIFSSILYLAKPYILKLGNIYETNNSSNVYDAFLLCMVLYSLNLGFFSFWSSLGKTSYHLKMQFLWSIILVASCIFSIKEIGAISIPLGMIAAFVLQFIFQITKWKQL